MSNMVVLLLGRNAQDPIWSLLRIIGTRIRRERDVETGIPAELSRSSGRRKCRAWRSVSGALLSAAALLLRHVERTMDYPHNESE